jgi:hypothetical protein
VRRWYPRANEQSDGSNQPGKKWPSQSPSTAGVEDVGVKGIEVGEVMDQIFYVAYIIVCIGLSEPNPVFDKNLVVGQGYAYIQ